MECVEPNPGPSALDALELFAKKAGIQSTDARIGLLLEYIKTKVVHKIKVKLKYSPF